MSRTRPVPFVVTFIRDPVSTPGGMRTSKAFLFVSVLSPTFKDLIVPVNASLKVILIG